MQCSEPNPRRRPVAAPGQPSIERLETRQLLHGGASDFHIQFAPAKATPVDGYVVDAGGLFGTRDDGLNFGWTKKKSAKPALRRDTPLSPDARYDGFAQVKRGATWEIALPNGTYTVHAVAGDSKAKRGSYGFDVEGAPLLRGETDRITRWSEGTATVTLTDGVLTLTGADGFKRNKINFLDISPVVTDVPDPDPGPGEEPDPPPGHLPKPGDPGRLTISGWTAGAPSPIERSEAVGAAVGGKLYVLGGIDGPGSNYAYPITARSDVYDPATNTWTRVADMPEPFTHANATVVGTTIWFVGSYVGDSPGPGTTHVWKYDTVTDAWSRGPDLPEPRGSGASALVGRTLHYFGGGDATRKDRTDHWSLNLDDPAGTWVRRASLPLSRNHMSGVALGGKIYAIGGQVGDKDGARDVANVDVYDPATDTWTAAAKLPGPRSHTNACTFVYRDKIYVVGGESGHQSLESEILSYDPATNAWSTVGMLPGPRSTAVAGIIGDQLVVATGNAPGKTDNVWLGAIA